MHGFMEVHMRKVLLSLLCGAAAVATFGATADDASARSYRWYRDYAPMYPQVYYGPPAMYVVPPAYPYYPRKVYSACCGGYVVGPAYTYYPAPVVVPVQRYVQPYYVAPARGAYYGGRRAARCCR